MFRIYRDVRFSPDKRPYKTYVSARFSHVMGRDVHAPGFYVHLEPSSVFSRPAFGTQIPRRWPRSATSS
jgi:uncharacterized protein (DUF2461 family)